MSDTLTSTEALIDSLVPTAWRLVDAVHDKDADTIQEIIATCPRVDVVAIVLAASLPHREPRQRRDGRVVGCGSNAGYQLHIDLGEPTCASCRQAHAELNAAYRATRRQQVLDRARAQTADAIRRRAQPRLGPGVAPALRTA